MLKKKIALLIAVVMMAVMALPASASFVSSPVAGLSPEVIPIGENYYAELIDGNGNIVAEIGGSELIITHYDNRDDAPYPHIKEALEKAYGEIMDADTLSQLCDKLDAIIKEIAPELSAETVVVGDLFDLTLIGENGELLDADNISMKVRFKLDYDSRNLIAVVQKVNGEYWETIPNHLITRHDDNHTVDIVLKGLGPILFLDDPGELVVPEGPDSPQTGAAEDNSFVAAFVCAIGALVCAGAAITVAKKKQETK